MPGLVFKWFPLCEFSLGCNGPHRSVAMRSYPTSKERQLHGPRRAERSYSTFKVRRGSHEEILHCPR